MRSLLQSGRSQSLCEGDIYAKVEEPAILIWIRRRCWENMNSRRRVGIYKDSEVEKMLLSSEKLSQPLWLELHR